MSGERRSPIGFVALWNKTEAEYRATPVDELQTTLRIQDAFANSRGRGNITYGLFATRWASSYAYMTFWRCPSAIALFDSIADLERAGDFKFADSYHVFGPLTPGAKCVSPGTWERIPDLLAAEATPPVGLFVQWNGDREMRSMEPDTVLASLGGNGLQLLGDYGSRHSSRWSRFAFAIATDVHVSGQATAALRRAADRGGIDVKVMAGHLQRYYRFASHLRMDSPWLKKEQQ